MGRRLGAGAILCLLVQQPWTKGLLWARSRNKRKGNSGRVCQGLRPSAAAAPCPGHSQEAEPRAVARQGRAGQGGAVPHRAVREQGPGKDVRPPPGAGKQELDPI